MPTTVMIPRKHPNDPIPEERLARFTQQGRCVSDRFVACKAGGMLMNKLLGFIEDEGAQVVSISESQVTLRMGQPWYRRWSLGRDRRRPVEVKIQFAEPGEDLATWKQANARRSVVDVQLRPLTPTFRTHEFHRRADAILRTLRLYFVAD